MGLRLQYLHHLRRPLHCLLLSAALLHQQLLLLLHRGRHLPRY